MGVVLTKYHTVSELLKLLSNDTLNTGEKISIILTIGHCTEVCGKIFFLFSFCQFLLNSHTLTTSVVVFHQDWNTRKRSIK